jgi:hypothetical protein
VEENEGNSQRQQQLDADGLELQVDGVEDVRAQERARPEQDDHARNTERGGHELRDKPGGEDERQSLDDVAGLHRRDSDRRRGRLRMPAP